MREVASFPRGVREIMTVWIPMPDGCRLAARMWLPVDAEADPVPAVLEYLPYRRRDGTAARDAVTQPYLAGHGYAAVRVDIRGTGDSDGLIRDEYDAPEIADGVAIIAWLAAQPWCNGQVGMWGISWGGFNALQVAAQAPPALKAIMPMGFTHDRYEGDCHYMGGCVLEGNISWGNTFLAGSSRPPDPEITGPGWRTQWLERLEAIEHPIGIWLQHQRRDDYWKPGSVCEDYGRIKAAVYAVSGWQDSYSRNVLTLLAHLSSPCKGLIGPWAHAWPHAARPGPAIGFLQEAIRWWDHWLKGHDTGIMDEPRLRIWVNTWSAPSKLLPQANGHWIQAASTAALETGRTLLHLGATTLSWQPPHASAEISIASPQSLGSTAGYQNSYGLGPDLSDDQRGDDAISACFDTDILVDPIQICGEIHLDLVVTSDVPHGILAARLCEVAADGASLRISYGLLNLSHRDGHADPKPMIPGAPTAIRLTLCAAAHRFSPGHRLRLALSTAYWPIAWPSPTPATIVLHTAGSALSLPLHPDDGPAPPPFAEPEGAAPAAITALRPRETDRPQDRITTDPVTGELVISRDRDRGAWHTADTDIAYDTTGILQFRIHPADPLTARQDFTLTSSIGRPGWQTRTIASSHLSATADAFHLTASLEAFEGEARVFERTWSLDIPRDGC